MARDYILPPEVDLTVDDLAILPDECRYVLIEGKLDLWDRQPLPQLAPLALMAASPPGFQVVSRRPLDAEGHAGGLRLMSTPAREPMRAIVGRVSARRGLGSATDKLSLSI